MDTTKSLATNCAPAATNFFPSAEVATLTATLPGTLFEVQVVPESAEVKINSLKAGSSAEATNLVPSADKAMERHAQLGTLLFVQVVPESDEVQITPLSRSTATSFVPSAEEATDRQLLVFDALVFDQEAPEFVETPMAV